MRCVHFLHSADDVASLPGCCAAILRLQSSAAGFALTETLRTRAAFLLWRLFRQLTVSPAGLAVAAAVWCAGSVSLMHSYGRYRPVNCPPSWHLSSCKRCCRVHTKYCVCYSEQLVGGCWFRVWLTVSAALVALVADC